MPKDKSFSVILWKHEWPQAFFLTLDNDNLPKGVPINSWDDKEDVNFCAVVSAHTGCNVTVKRTIQTTNG